MELFHEISQDAETHVVILTGPGDAFIDRIDAEGFDFFSPRGYDKLYCEGKKVLLNLIDIPVPVIAALNGPTTIQSEYVLLADVAIATPDTVFQDKPHFVFRIVPGDGIRSLWPEVIGSIRGRTFVLTQQTIGAEETRRLGVVSEIVTRDRLLGRAREIATRIAKAPCAHRQLYPRRIDAEAPSHRRRKHRPRSGAGGNFRRRRCAFFVRRLDSLWTKSLDTTFKTCARR